MSLIRPLSLLLALSIAACAAPAEEAERVEGRGADTQHWSDKLPRADWGQYERILPDQDWFEVYRIRPGVTAIYEPGQFEEVISFLIEGDERALLFDTGLGIGDMDALVQTLCDKPVIVINSHSHYDHVGGNHAFEAILGPDTAYGRTHARGRPHQDMKEYVSPAWLGNKGLPEDFSPEAYKSRPYDLTPTLQDGQQIDLGGRMLEILLIPGHAPDALALLDRAHGDLYVGDTFYLAPLYAHLNGSNPDLYRTTAARLAALAPDLDDVMTAHNVPIVSPDYLIKLDAGFTAIANGKVTGKPTDGARQYSFDGFSIIMPDLPPAD